MAKISRVGMEIETSYQIEMNESEVAALDALFGYNMSAFLKTFYREMGECYLKPHEAGLISLAESVRGCASLNKAAEECREFLSLIATERNAAIQNARDSRRRLTRVG